MIMISTEVACNLKDVLYFHFIIAEEVNRDWSKCD